MERWARVPTSVLQRPELSSADKIVFVALCSFADKLGRCFPKRATLAEYTSLSVRTISTSIANLTAAGVITQQQRTGTTPLYIVVPLAPVARVEDTPANIARVASSAAYVNESGALADKVRRLFSEAFPGHGVGNTNYVQKYIRERGRGKQSAKQTDGRLPYAVKEHSEQVCPLVFHRRKSIGVIAEIESVRESERPSLRTVKRILRRCFQRT